MNPAIWGPPTWFFLHSITLAYPSNPTISDKKSHLDFFSILPDVLPCPKCKEHLKTHLNNFPIQPALESKDAIIAWLHNLHNQVNISLNKPQVSLESFLKNYKDIYDRSSLNINQLIDDSELYKNLLIALTLLFTILGGFWFWKSKSLKRF